MRLILAFILVAQVVSGRAQSFLDERFTFSIKESTLEQALEELRKVSKASFYYDPQLVKNHQVKATTFSNKKLSEILQQLLGNQLTYTLEGKSIIINRSKKSSATGSIGGTVLDAKTKEPLVGSNVILSGTTTGTRVDAEGKFLIANLSPGLYSIAVSFIGYQPRQYKDIKVTEGNVSMIHVEMAEESSVLNEIVIVSEDVRYAPINNSTERSMVSEIKDANLILTGISNEQIRKSLDRDASDVIRRVSSATVVNDRFVLLRGLDPRYTLTMVNNFIAPSAETDTRDFSFDMIQSNAVDRITIYKSPVPELPADYVGGVVKIFTKNTAQSRQIQLQLSTQYRTGTTFDDFNSYEGSKTDWLGYDNSVRALPKDFPDEYDLPRTNGDAIEKSGYDSKALWQASQKASWNTQRKTAGLDKRGVINYYDSWPLGRMRLNNLTSIAYTQTKQNQYIKGAYIPLGNLSNYRMDSLSIEGVRVSGMQNFRLVINDKNSIDFNNFLTQLSDDNTLVRYRNGKGGDFTQAAFAKAFEYRFRSRFLYTGQLAGSHELNNSSLQWRFGYNRTREKLPNYRGAASARNLEDSSLDFFNGFNEFFVRPFAFWHDLLEESYVGAVDYDLKVIKNVRLKAGSYYEHKQRGFTSRRFSLSIGDPATVPGDYAYHLDDYLTDDDLQSPGGSGKRVYMDESSGVVSYSGVNIPDYRAQNDQLAFYAALQVPMFQDKLILYGGVRAEYNRQQLWAPQMWSVGDGTRVEKQQRDSVGVDWLPSVNVTYKLTPSMQLRGGYGYTVNRPVFREVANWSFYEMSTNSSLWGNLILYQARAANADLRWEWYLSDRQLISAGVFYKFIVDPIERYANAAAQGASNVFINSRDAKALGVEIEMRKDFGFLGSRKFFKDLSVISNVSFLKTEVRTARNVIGDMRAITGDRFEPVSKEIRTLVGSSPYVVNAGLYYDNDVLGTQVSLLYNVIGQRLVVAGSAASIGEIYELPRHVIDFVYTQRLNSYITVKAGVQDILNQAFRFYRDVNRNEKYDPHGYNLTDLAIETGERMGGQDLNNAINFIPDVETIDYLETTFKPGSYFSFGINLTF